MEISRNLSEQSFQADFERITLKNYLRDYLHPLKSPDFRLLVLKCAGSYLRVFTVLRIRQFRNIKTPINNLYREFGVLKLTDMHDFSICCIVHKFMYLRHLLSEAMNDTFCRNEQIHHYNTRNKKDLHPIK